MLGAEPGGTAGAENEIAPSAKVRRRGDGRSGSRGGIYRYVAPMSAQCIVTTMTSAVADGRSALAIIVVKAGALVIIEGLERVRWPV